ncbi:winged helix-turn-helix domain-containing protein [Streptomyces misionensis]|uniref:winged helix-turn-helix domain-containing protein n=1 Tax=Streptomyces misionensis TaxID=67331 RepID=UPI003BAFE014
MHFLRHPGGAASREEPMREVWGREFGDLSTVTVHVRRLREKFEDSPDAPPRPVNTVRGVGCRFDAARRTGRPPGALPGRVSRPAARPSRTPPSPRRSRPAAAIPAPRTTGARTR